MPKPHSIDFVEKVINTMNKLADVEEVSELFGIGVSTVYKYLALGRKGNIPPKKPGPKGGGRVNLIEFADYIERNPTKTYI